MGIFVAAVIVLIVLIYFMIVMLRSVVSEAGHQVNSYFLKNLESYDAQFKEKFRQMNELKEEQETLNREVKSMKSELVSYKTSPFYAPRPLARDVYIPTARYIDNDFFEEYKIAKDKLLSINKQQVINNVMGKVEYVGDMDRYQTACRIIEKLNFEAVYDLCSVEKEDQLSVLKECLDNQEAALLLEYVGNMQEMEEFDILAFLDYIKKVKNDNDPFVYVSVGENENDYSDEERKIICSVDDNICEGIKIIYQNKIYDYSIYKTRRKVGS